MGCGKLKIIEAQIWIQAAEHLAIIVWFIPLTPVQCQIIHWTILDKA